MPVKWVELKISIQEYLEWTRTTAIYKWKVYYPAMELCGEVGEVLNQIKKAHRDDDNEITTERKDTLKKELGDVCWALCRLVDDLDLDIEEILLYNKNKLTMRKKNNTLQGSGDNR